MSDGPKYRDEEWLREQYVERRLDKVKIAGKAQCSDMAVRYWLDKYDITRPAPKYHDENWLREQYQNRGLSVCDIAERCDASKSTVYDWIVKHGIDIRSPTPDQRLKDKNWLREQYHSKQKSTYEIADECECGATTVSKWLKEHGIKTAPKGGRPADERLRDESWLRAEYIDKGYSTTKIADKCGTVSSTVSRWLKEHGIETAPNGGRPADERLRDESWLRKQYADRGLTVYEIGDMCGCAGATVAEWLKKHEIEARKPRPPVSDERLESKSWLEEKYVNRERSTSSIAQECGCSRETVINWLHKHDIQVRGRALFGEENPNWRGGRAPYGPGWNEKKRREVRERDGHTCQDPRCSVTQDEHLNEHDEKLHVHHLRKARDVDDPEERNAPENLITLCSSCHVRWERVANAGLIPQLDRENPARTH